MVFLWCKLRIYYAAWSKTYNIWIHCTCITGRINSAVAYPVQYLVKSFMYPQTTTPPHTMGTHQLSMSQTVAKLGSNCNMTTKCFRSNQQQFEEERRKREAIRGVKESSDVFVFTGEWRTWMALHCLAKQLTKMSRMFRRTNSVTARRRRPVGGR